MSKWSSSTKAGADCRTRKNAECLSRGTQASFSFNARREAAATAALTSGDIVWWVISLRFSSWTGAKGKKTELSAGQPIWASARLRLFSNRGESWFVAVDECYWNRVSLVLTWQARDLICFHQSSLVKEFLICFDRVVPRLHLQLPAYLERMNLPTHSEFHLQSCVK